MFITIAFLLTFAQCAEFTLKEFEGRVEAEISNYRCASDDECHIHKDGEDQPEMFPCCKKRYYQRGDIYKKHQNIKDTHADIIKTIRQATRLTACACKKVPLDVTVKLRMINGGENLGVWVKESYKIDGMRIRDVKRLTKNHALYKLRELKSITNEGRIDPAQAELVIIPFSLKKDCYEINLVLREIQTE